MLINKFILISFLSIFQIVSANISLNSAVDKKKIFLDELQIEMEQNEKSATIEEKDQIDDCLGNIDLAKKALISIKQEQEKGKNKDKKLLLDLVDEYNKKLNEIKKSYHFFKGKSTKELDNPEFSKRSNSDSIESLNWEKRRRKNLNDSDFAPLEIVEIPACQSSIEDGIKHNNKIIIKSNEEVN